MDEANYDGTSEISKLEDEPPPFLGQWKRIYLMVLFYLFTLVASLYAITRIFRY